MRGGGQARRYGNAAEAFVLSKLQEEHPCSAFFPLQQDAPADIVELVDTGVWVLYEVKSSKTRRRALSAPLSEPEKEAMALWGPSGRYIVIRVQRLSNYEFEVVRRDGA